MVAARGPVRDIVYDMRVEPGEVKLAPMDGEVESFEVSLFSPVLLLVVSYDVR